MGDQVYLNYVSLIGTKINASPTSPTSHTNKSSPTTAPITASPTVQYTTATPTTGPPTITHPATSLFTTDDAEILLLTTANPPSSVLIIINDENIIYILTVTVSVLCVLCCFCTGFGIMLCKIYFSSREKKKEMKIIHLPNITLTSTTSTNSNKGLENVTMKTQSIHRMNPGEIDLDVINDIIVDRTIDLDVITMHKNSANNVYTHINTGDDILNYDNEQMYTVSNNDNMRKPAIPCCTPTLTMKNTYSDISIQHQINSHYINTGAVDDDDLFDYDNEEMYIALYLG